MDEKAKSVKRPDRASGASGPICTPRKDGSIRMANSHGWEYWIRPKDVAALMAQKKPWTKVPDPPDGKYGPTGPPRKG